MVTRTDKGEKIIIVYSKEYEDKMNYFLNDGNTYTILIKRMKYIINN